MNGKQTLSKVICQIALRRRFIFFHQFVKTLLPEEDETFLAESLDGDAGIVD